MCDRIIAFTDLAFATNASTPSLMLRDTGLTLCQSVASALSAAVRWLVVRAHIGLAELLPGRVQNDNVWNALLLCLQTPCSFGTDTEDA